MKLKLRNNLLLISFLFFFTFCTKKEEVTLVTIGKAPNFELIDHHNNNFTDEKLKDKVYVLEFFFSTCPTVCPIMNENLKEVEKSIGQRDDFAIVSITINPLYDTPAVLNSHKQQLGIKADNWFFLTGDQKYIHTLSEKYNLFASENGDAPGGFEHSGVYILVDKEGNIRSREDKFGNPIFFYTGLNYTDEEGFEENASGEFKPGVNAIINDINILLRKK